MALWVCFQRGVQINLSFDKELSEQKKRKLYKIRHPLQDKPLRMLHNNPICITGQDANKVYEQFIRCSEFAYIKIFSINLL